LPLHALGSGTLDDPFYIDDFPFVHAYDTDLGESNIDRYGCASHLDEGGPEVIYACGCPGAGLVTAWIEGDIAGIVDVDVHITQDITVSGRTAECLGRGHTWAEAEVAAGDLWVSVDTYVEGGTPLSGPYVLRVDFIPFDEDRVRDVGVGVRWVEHIYSDLYGGRQTVNILEIDLLNEEVEIKPVFPGGCATVRTMGGDAGALAGINAGFFGPGCSPVGLVRIDNEVYAYNPGDRPPRIAIGVGPGEVQFREAGYGDGFDEAVHALGGLPRLLTDGAVTVNWAEEGTNEEFATYRHPRSCVCVTGDSHLLLVTLDGRTDAGIGIDLYDLADYLFSLGCLEGMNFDGGGSTTLWVDGMAAGGVVNYPSDNGAADHAGSRAVSNGLFVWTRPVNHPPRFVTAPPEEAREGIEYVYLAEVVDIDLDEITFGLTEGPEGMAHDEGMLSWTPTWRDAGENPVTIEADDSENSVEQSFTINVEIIDEDGDSLPDTWEQEIGLDPTQDDANEDADGDGLTNLEEFQMGTDPLDPDDPPRTGETGDIAETPGEIDGEMDIDAGDVEDPGDIAPGDGAAEGDGGSDLGMTQGCSCAIM